jgi:hypothetical protein
MVLISGPEISNSTTLYENGLVVGIVDNKVVLFLTAKPYNC